MKHTPGPWRIDNSWTDSYFIRSGLPDYGTDRTVVIVSKSKDEITEHADGARTYRKKPILTAKADAMLIAAAPDLLDALTDLRDAVKKSGAMEGREFVSLGSKVNAALAKAGVA